MKLNGVSFLPGAGKVQHRAQAALIEAGLEIQRGAVQRGNALNDGQPQAASAPVAAEHSKKKTSGQLAALGCFDPRTVVAYRQAYPGGNGPRLDTHPAARRQ